MQVTHIERSIPLAKDSAYDKHYIFLISLITALGGLLFGYDLSIVSGTVSFFSEYFKLTAIQTGWAVGCINLGAVIGAIVSGKLGDKYGRKKLLLFCAFLFALTGVGTGWAGNFSLFIVFRILSGVAIGAAALVCPMYLAEIAPGNLRGRLVSFYQLVITIGILLAYFSDYLLLNTGRDNWRWMFSSESAPALLFFFSLFIVPESPRWLIRKHQDRKARKILKKIGGTMYADRETKAIQQSFSNELKENISAMFRKDVFYIVVIGVIIAIFSQLSGQNAIFSYAPEIFKQAGVSADSALMQSVILGAVNFLFTFVSIGTIDKIGRKTLLLYGAILLSFDTLAIAGSFYLNFPGIWTLIFVLAFVAIYSATLGPVTWVALSEIFPNRIRGNAMSLATLFLWLANFFTIATFPAMKLYVGLPATYAIYAILCFIYFVFVRYKVPETKGKSLEEIERLLIRK